MKLRPMAACMARAQMERAAETARMLREGQHRPELYPALRRAIRMPSQTACRCRNVRLDNSDEPERVVDPNQQALPLDSWRDYSRELPVRNSLTLEVTP